MLIHIDAGYKHEQMDRVVKSQFEACKLTVDRENGDGPKIEYFKGLLAVQ